MMEKFSPFGEYTDLVLVLGLLAAAILMFVKNKPRMDAVAIIMIAALPFTGIISIEEALVGFSDPNIVLIAVLFVLGDGMVRTGVARNIGDWINKKAANSETKLMILLMIAVAGLGSVMSSTAIVAIFIPVVFRICSNSGIAPSQLMMPLSFAALISGMMTLISTAPNLVVNSELMRQGEAGFDFFTITPFGIAILILGLLYMLMAKKWLPNNSTDSSAKRKRPTFKVLVDKYNLREKEYRVAVGEDSPLLGMQINEIDFGSSSVNLLAVERKEGSKSVFNRPTKQMNFKAGDILLLDSGTNQGNLLKLFDRYKLEPLKLSGGREYLSSMKQEMGMTEAILPAESSWVGKSIKDARIRSETGLTVVGIWRANQVLTQDLLEVELKVGDTILLAGFWDDFKRVIQESDNVVLLYLPPEFEEVLPAADKAPHAVAILVLVVMLMVTGLIPNVHAVVLGCLLMGLFRIVDMTSAYNSISWKSLILIVGMMPFSIALQRTGGVELVSGSVLSLVGNDAPRVVLGTLFLVTAILGLFISNTATAVLMAPIAIAIANELGVSPYPLAMAVTLAASSAFMTPVSSPVNTMVVSPGNYKFGDFLKIGVPFTFLILILSILLIPVILPF